jgi:hypothetical protein
MSSGYQLSVVEDLPSPEQRGCRDIPYVLETLTLTTPTSEEEECDADTRSPELRHVFANPCRQLLLLSETRVSPIEKSLGPDGPGNKLFWFRWITGHQVSFIIWRLLAVAVADVKRGRGSGGSALQAMTHYIRGYCAMLLYASSCPREIYETLIRPSMFRRHEGFSGSWAPDFRAVRDLLRGRIPPWAENLDAAELRRAIKLSHLVHEAMAAKLVPNGRSLLQQSGFVHRDAVEDRRLLGAIYDDYFMTLRAPVGYDEVVTQLMRRLHAITRDVEANGLDARGTATHGDEFRLAEVVTFEAQFFNTCFRVAGFATGFTDDDMTEQQECQLGVLSG